MPANTIASPEAATNEILASRIFDAPRELVWKMWTDPNHVVHWYGPSGFSMTIHEMNVRPGGDWRFILHGPDGVDYDNHNVFRDIVEPERIVYEHRSYPPFQSTVTFTEEDTQTRVTVRMVFETAELRNQVAEEFGAAEGLEQTLDRLVARVNDFPFVIQRTFDAPRDLVFRVWTEAEHLMNWFSPRGVKTVSVTNDLRPGGVMHYGLQPPEGPAYWGRWVYREITPPERLVFVVSFSDEHRGITRHPMAPEWPKEMLSTVTFEEVGNKTRITVEWRPINVTERERRVFRDGHASMTQGWGGTLDQLEEYLSR